MVEARLMADLVLDELLGIVELDQVRNIRVPQRMQVELIRNLRGAARGRRRG